MALTDCYGNPASERDAGLRATLPELVLHLPCLGVRGPIGRVAALCDCVVNKGRWQSCPCEDHPVRWEGADVSRKVDLCVLCARATAGGTSRGAWLACGTCRDVNDVAPAPATQGCRSAGTRS